MSAPRGLARRFLAVFLSFSLIPLPPSPLLTAVFAAEPDEPKEPTQVAQVPRQTPGASSPVRQEEPPAAPVTDEEKREQAVRALTSLAEPLKAALDASGLKDMLASYAAAAKDIAALAAKHLDEAKQKEAEERAKVLEPLVKAKEANASLAATTEKLAAFAARSPLELTPDDWKAFDVLMRELDGQERLVSELVAAETGRRTNWGAEAPPEDLRELHGSVLGVLSREHAGTAKRWPDVRAFSLARPHSVTGDAAGQMLEDLRAALPESAQPALAQDVGRLRTRLAGLALSGSDPAAVNQEFRTFFEKAGLSGEALAKAEGALAASAQAQRGALTAPGALSRIPAGLLTPAELVPCRVGACGGAAPPTPGGSKPAGSVRAGPGLEGQLRAFTANMGLAAETALQPFSHAFGLVNGRMSEFSDSLRAAFPGAGQAPRKTADVADERVAGELRAGYGALTGRASALIESAPNRFDPATKPADLAAWRKTRDATMAELETRLGELDGGYGDGAKAGPAVAAERARAQALLKLLRSMDDVGFDPTSLDAASRPLLLGDIRNDEGLTAENAASRLGFVGQVMLLKGEERRKGLENAGRLVAAFKENGVLEGDPAGLDGRLAGFFDNADNAKLVEGTALAPVYAQWKAARERESKGEAAPPDQPSARESLNTLVSNLRVMRAQKEDDPVQRSQTMLYLSHANANQAAFEYLQAHPEEQAKHQRFLEAYRALAPPGKTPDAAALRAQQDATDLASDLFRNLPEYKAMLRLNMADADMAKRLAEVDPRAAAALATMGAPDLQNLRERAARQPVIDYMVQARALGLGAQDPQAWARAQDQALDYYYGAGFRKATEALGQSWSRTLEASRDGGADARRAAFLTGGEGRQSLAALFSGSATPL
ncbi:hypothetical protein EPO15_06835, partial [bacterium]